MPQGCIFSCPGLSAPEECENLCAGGTAGTPLGFITVGAAFVKNHPLPEWFGLEKPLKNISFNLCHGQGHLPTFHSASLLRVRVKGTGGTSKDHSPKRDLIHAGGVHLAKVCSCHHPHGAGVCSSHKWRMSCLADLAFCKRGPCGCNQCCAELLKPKTKPE